MIEYILPPLLGFIIGYGTNYLAIKMLFHPRRPLFGFQGLIPKRKQELARSIAKTITEIMPESYKKATKLPFIGSTIHTQFTNAIERQILKQRNEDLEKHIHTIAHNELRAITLIGGLLGFLVGCLHVLITLYI